MKLKEIMNTDVEVVHPDDTLQTAARKMCERDIGFLPVCNGERLVGALSDRDVTVKAIAQGKDPRTTRVKDVAHPGPIWCFDDQNLSVAARKMKVNKIRRLMVIRRDDRQLVGVVSLGDLVNKGSEKMTSSVLHSVSPTSFDT